MTIELDAYVQTIYGESEGYVYGATSWDQKWSQRFFEWPNDHDAIMDWVKQSKDARNVFLAPSLFSERNSKKESWKQSHVVWAEIDDGLDDLRGVPAPTIIVQSSNPMHLHCYWNIGTCTSSDALEDVNRRLAWHLDADYSGWDCNQVLRPPSSWNHKRDLPVKLLYLNSEIKLTLGALREVLPTIDAPKGELTAIETVPPIEEVLNKYLVNAEILAAIKDGYERGKRSTGLMRLGYLLAQMGMERNEMLSVLLSVDEQIGKFAGRSDQMIRLNEIISIAKAAYPTKFSVSIVEPVTVLGKDEENPFHPISFTSLAFKEVKIEWIWEKLLRKNGFLILSGPPGVGKSQFTLDALAHLVMQREFLGQQILAPSKVGFLSLEMDESVLSDIAHKQLTTWTDEEQITLEQNFTVYPFAEMLDLTKPQNQEALERQIREDGLNGLVVDALSSTTLEGLSDEKAAKAVIGWLTHLRKSLGIFVWLIHHNRKATSDNPKANRIGDVHGSVFIGAQPDTILILWKTEKGALELIPVKTRSSDLDQRDPYTLTRHPSLTFTHALKGVEVKEVDTKSPGGPTF